MNTPAHLIFAAAAFARPTQPRVTWAALAGGLAPDLSLYLLAGISLYALDIPARVVFGELYYSELWQGIFAVDNSFVVWGVLFYAAWRLTRPAWMAFAGGALIHLALDFPLHHEDARQHFWPLTDWAFASPVSYWDSDHYGGIVGPVEVIACSVLTLILLRRFGRWRPGLGLAALWGAEVMASGVWVFIF